MIVAFVILGVLSVSVLVLIAVQVRAMIAVRDEAHSTGGKVAPLPNNLVTLLRGKRSPDED